MYYYTDTVVFSSLVSVCVTLGRVAECLGDAARREADGRKNDNGRKNESSDVS
jgi:hypothetical protein